MVYLDSFYLLCWFSFQLLLEQIAGPRAKDDFLREAKVMAGLDHPCIVKLVGVCEGPPLMLVQVRFIWAKLLPQNLDIIIRGFTRSIRFR